MISIGQWVIGLVALAGVVGGGYWFSSNDQRNGVSAASQVVAKEVRVPSSLKTSSSDTSTKAIDEDLRALDAQLQALDADAAGIQFGVAGAKSQQ